MHLNFARFAPMIPLDVRTPTGRCQTCQNILWFCKHGQKGRNRTLKIVFFSLNYKSFLIQSGFEQLCSSIRGRL